MILSSTIKQFSLLGDIRFAENEKEIEKIVDKIMKKHSSLIEIDAEVIPIENIKEYTNEVVAEVKKLKEHSE